MVALFQGRTVKEVKVILERMIKVNHWSLGGDNKARLSQLFAFLLQYLDDSVDPQEPKVSGSVNCIRSGLTKQV
ncbi:nucleolar protein 14-like [Diaphorina citri]|uniref:Nucleolar protein 14-like n=1 Tax=Diaphorina citri TaxID=121845 RepID=A0A1S3DQ60_DIACI|nr:nucleolar protein 14-like [Diaphorina citri]